MRKPKSVPDALQGRAFTYSDGIAAGMTPDRLRTRDLHKPFHGVRSCKPILTRLDRAMALGTRLREGQALAGLAAAELWGLPLQGDAAKKPEHVDVLSRLSASRVRIKDVKNRRIRDDLFRAFTLGGVPVVSPVLTLITSAEHLSGRDITVMIDALLAESNLYPRLWFTSRPHLAADSFPSLTQKFQGMRGMPKVRSAAELARPGSESPMESILRLKLIEQGLPEPVIQPVLTLPNGKEYRPDLGYPTAKLYIDYDGEHHFVDESTRNRDVLRDRQLQDSGLKIIHVVKADLSGARLKELVGSIARRLREFDAM